MSRPRGPFRRLRNRVLGALVLAVAFAACRPDRLLEHRGENHGEQRPPPRTSGHPPSPRHPPVRDGGPESPPPSQAGATPSVHLALGVPESASRDDDYLIIKPQYALSYNRIRNGANWVSWNLDASYFGRTARHKGKFLADDSLPSGFYRVQDRDYAGSGYDRGHMVRSEERTRSVEDNASTFLLPNVLPQRHDLNAGPWLRLEEYCQELAQKEDKELYLTAGGVFSAHPDVIGHGVAVPDAFFKIIVVLSRGQGAADVNERTRVIAVIMPNTEGILDEPWGQYRTSVREISQRTGYHFFTALPEPVRRALESGVDSGPVH